MGPLEEIKKLYEQRDRAAREWKAQGGKVVGYISDDVPDEMVLAAGFFPFRMSGDPEERHRGGGQIHRILSGSFCTVYIEYALNGKI